MSAADAARKKCREIVPEDLFAYVKRYKARNHFYPSVREAAARFSVKQGEIERLCDDWDGDGYMKLAVAEGNASGFREFENIGSCLVEAYD